MSHKIHDYQQKLQQPGVFGEVRAAITGASGESPGPGRPPASKASLGGAFEATLEEVGGPLSINLDLTVACNYHCTHCIDLEMLNSKHRYQLQGILDSLVVMTLAGLRSVILIGGGEPTLHPSFVETVKAIKALGLQCAIVSNGSLTGRLEEVAPHLTSGDWIRLSLDSGRDDTFRAMHNPRKKTLGLLEICAGAQKVKEANPEVQLGFSYIISWQGAEVQGRPILDNVDEMTEATELARSHDFDYISFKPILTRDYGGAETISLPGQGAVEGRTPVERISEQLESAQRLANERFRVVPSRNLIAMIEEISTAESRNQPQVCRMHLFRQVLTAVGTFGCPVYRDNDKSRVGNPLAYRSIDDFLVTRRRTVELMHSFDASHECRNVTCLYNSTNRWLDDLVAEGASGGPEPATPQSPVAPSECFL